MRHRASRSTLPGDPAAIWASTLASPLPRLDRPRDDPRPESVEEVAHWEDPDGFGRVELYYAPAFWVLIPVAALGYLIWGAVTNPDGHGWVGTVFDETVEGAPWSFWLVWAGVGIWLLIAIGVLDRTPRTARVVLNADDGEGHTLLLRYKGVDGHKHNAQLADYPDETWIDRFVPGSTWQVYAFQAPELADSVVFLTELHDDVWRAGYVLDGVRIGGEGGPLKPAPGSPFLREDSTWKFSA